MDGMKQAETIWSGMHIADQRDENHNILFCQIDAFYAKVFYTLGNSNRHAATQLVQEFLIFVTFFYILSLQGYSREIEILKKLYEKD